MMWFFDRSFTSILKQDVFIVNFEFLKKSIRNNLSMLHDKSLDELKRAAEKCGRGQ